MIVFFEYGRLGNQLFQYFGIKKYFPKHNLVFFGCEDLASAVESVDAKFVTNNRFPKWILFGIFRRITIWAAQIRLIGSISEIRHSQHHTVKVQKGIIPSVYIMLPSFFQHTQLVNGHDISIKLKMALIEQAKDWLYSRMNQPVTRMMVFVHIRRGDYLSWPSRDFPAILDLAWYQRAMERVKEEIKNPFFIIITDDFYYAADIFGEEDDILISDNDFLVDLALMSLCHGGILSASSFSWWGAWLSKQGNVEKHGSSMYIAPKFWSGHRRKEWYPANFCVDWITYI